MDRRRAVILTTSLLVVVIGAMAVYGAWRVLSAAPDEVSLEAVVASLEDKDSPESSSSTAISEDVEAEVDSEEKASSSDDGVWYVDSNSGSFTFDDSSGSFVGFRVEEELAQIGSMTAVGRTGDVEGQLVIENGELVEVAVSADLSTIVTNDSRRDRAARHALNVREHPMATFVLEEPVTLPGADDVSVSMEVLGQLTVNGIGRQVPGKIEAQLVDATSVGVGSIDVTVIDYDVVVPSAIIVVSAEDHGIVEFQLLFIRG